MSSNDSENDLFYAHDYGITTRKVIEDDFKEHSTGKVTFQRKAKRFKIKKLMRCLLKESE